MSDTDLPANVRRLVESVVPTMDALELLVFLARHPNEQWTAAEMASEMHPVVIAAPAVNQYLALFESHGLVSTTPDARFQHRPTSPELEAACSALVKAYAERPVTLIRTVYGTVESSKIQSFADAFKIKKD